MKKLLLILCCTLSTGAYAANCSDLSEATQTEISECNKSTLSITQKALTSTYNKLYKSTTSKKELVASQKAWIDYKNKQCAFEDANNDSVTMASIINSQNCEIKFNKERNDQLEDFLN